MSDKTKRKVNPRRRTLIRLIMFIGIVVALIVSGIYLLCPKGAQIVFIAPDDEGIEQIWIANVNHPENPRQMTYHEQSVRQIDVSTQNKILIYMLVSEANSDENQLWYLNVRTGRQEMLPFQCEVYDGCETYRLSPDGKWLSYQQVQSESNQFAVNVYLYHLNIGDTRLIHTQYYDYSPGVTFTPYPVWIGHTNLLSYHSSVSTYENPVTDEYVIYSIDEERIIEQIEVNQSLPAPPALSFSDDGSRYAVNQAAWLVNPIVYVDIYHREIDDRTDYPTIQAIDGQQLSIGALMDWHPDNEHLLFGEVWYSENDRSTRSALNLFNIETQDNDILFYVEEHMDSVTFNYDGSQLLYGSGNNRPGILQLMLYDMETQEEIPLPLFGRNPQWVNGGR